MVESGNHSMDSSIRPFEHDAVSVFDAPDASRAARAKTGRPGGDQRVVLSAPESEFERVHSE